MSFYHIGIEIQDKREHQPINMFMSYKRLKTPMSKFLPSEATGRV